MPRVKRPAIPFESVGYIITLRGKQRHMDPTDIGDRLGMCRNTILSRLREPSKLTLGELQRISVVLGIPLTELLEAAMSG